MGDLGWGACFDGGQGPQEQGLPGMGQAVQEAGGVEEQVQAAQHARSAQQGLRQCMRQQAMQHH